MTEYKGAKCPICDEPLIECDEVLIEEARSSSYMYSCVNCQRLFGGYT